MIKSIHIENYKSIKDLFIEPENLCAIIGSNSVGKTNVLKAIDLVLGEGWATKAKVVKELFNNTNEPINIRIDFNNSLQHDYYGTIYNINYVTLKMEMYPEFKCEVRLRSNDSDKEFYITEEFKRKCHFIYIPSDRDLAKQMRVSSWTLLGKLMKEIYNNYVNFYNGNEEKLRDEFKVLMDEPRQFLEDDFDENNITFKKFSDCFTKHCENNSVGLASGMKPELNIYNLNWFYKTLQITLTENHTDKIFDSDEVGSGMQNLVLLSIFQTYAELIGGNVIFGVEEPEIYLYPQAQRALYKSFQEISESSQIFYTSHNPNFIDAARAYELEILKKTKDEGTIKLEKNTTYINKIKAEQERFRIFTHFNTERNEIFFAKKVLLVEGDSDRIFYQTLCEEYWDYDLDKNGVSILSCGGKGGVSYFTGLCVAMGIDSYFSVWDEDEGLENNYLLDKTKKEKNGLELSPNLETFLNEKLGFDLSDKSSMKVKQAYEIVKEKLNYEVSVQYFGIIKEFLEG